MGDPSDFDSAAKVSVLKEIIGLAKSMKKHKPEEDKMPPGEDSEFPEHEMKESPAEEFLEHKTGKEAQDEDEDSNSFLSKLAEAIKKRT